jgi:hypothetical protein
MLWALSDKSGGPARYFADFNPAPSLEWLTKAFSDRRFTHTDLSRFGVTPRQEVDPKLSFALVDRPAPYSLAPQMMLVSTGLSPSHWDTVMFEISRWLLRHLNDPELVIWILERGGHMNHRFASLIAERLGEIARLEASGEHDKLDDIRGHSSNGIPSKSMRQLWRLLLSGRTKSPFRDPDLYQWLNRLKTDGLDVFMRLELMKMLAPKVKLSKPVFWGDENGETEEPTRLRELVGWEVVLDADNVRSTLSELAEERWSPTLTILVDDFERLLIDALDLLQELGEANEHFDRSNWDLPSVFPHWQNRGFRDRVTLIELLRDSWLAVRCADSSRATKIAQAWFSRPYPTFKRLAFFAASHENCVDPDQWVEWLTNGDAWWLWSASTKREVSRLLVLQGHVLPKHARSRIEKAILAGPPRAMYKDEVEARRWKQIVDHSIWLLLAKLQSSGLLLSAKASGRLNRLSQRYPDWALAENERDEFSSWMSGTGDPDYLSSFEVAVAPLKRHDLVEWLANPPPDRNGFQRDTWSESCQQRPINTLFALGDLGQRGIWPIERWRDALQAWSSHKRIARIWYFAFSILDSMPDEVMVEITHSLGRWMDTLSKVRLTDETPFFGMCRRILDLPLNADTGMTQNGAPIDQAVTEAINHPVGQVTQALLNRWFQRGLNDNAGLSADLEPFFTCLCDVRIASYRHGRVILASNLIALFRVDRGWAERDLLPLFQWTDNPQEAKSVWEGFLWNPRLYRPLVMALKSQLLETAHHYHELNEHAQQYAGFLTFVALGPIEGFTVEDFRNAIGALPEQGLEESAQALSQAMEGAAEQREEYWHSRIQPFWHHIWPKDRDRATSRIAESLARMCLAAGNEFPAAVAEVRNWLKPLEHPHFVVHTLFATGYCERFPAESLEFLSLLIHEQPWAPRELGQCLDMIAAASPESIPQPAFQALKAHFRQRAM